MAILNQLFNPTESLAKRAEQDEEAAVRSWKEYLATLPEKEEIIRKLPFWFGQRKQAILRLQQLLNGELADVRKGQQDDNDLIATIMALEHSRKIQRVHRLEDALRYVETKYDYVYELLKHLFAALASEAVVLEKLAKAAEVRKYKALAASLHNECMVEQAILKKISDIRTFHSLFTALATGEHIIHAMDAKERKLHRRLKKVIDASNPRDSRMTYQWMRAVFTSIEDKVHEAVADGILDDPGEYHHAIDFEFVNRPEFAGLVRESLRSIKKRQVSEQMITVFVHLFRGWYNHERE